MKKIYKLLTLGFITSVIQNANAQCPVPSLVTASPATLCAGATTSLNATAAGAAINWYTVPVGGTPIGSSPSGVNYSVIPVNTTTYYAESFVNAVASNTYNYTGSLQSYTIPVGVSQITVEARGAQGGNAGGSGARIIGEFAVVAGDVINMLVGQIGVTSPNNNGGGGGGTYVWRQSGTLLFAVAGGGGGRAGNSNASLGGGGSATSTPNNSINGSGNGAGGAGGNGGTGGVYISPASYSGGGGAGAGWISDGLNGTGGAYNATGGARPSVGGAGGTGYNPCDLINVVGGYGGGGGGGGCSGSGGGGGGYNGGGGGNSWNGSTWGSGGGGGSYNNGTNQNNTASFQSGNGLVILTVNIPGCVSISRTPVTVTVNANPTITVNSGSICSGQSFTMVPSGANTYTYQGGNAVVSPTANANYTVVGTSSAGCVSQSFATANVTVNANPTITVNSGVICAGNSFTMVPSGANSYTYQGGNAVVNPTATSAYTVVGTSTNGCISPAFATSNVTVNPNPTLTISGSTLICGTNTNVLTANGANSYSWSTGANTASISASPTITTTYTVVGTNTLGSCATTSTVSIIVSTNPTVLVTGSIVICNGQTTNLTASGANTYSWSNGVVTATAALSPSATSVYTVVGTNTAGCMGTNIQTVTVKDVPAVSIAGTATICVGESTTLTANGATTYSWNTGASTSSIVVSPTVTTSYTAVGTSTNGCDGTASTNVVVNPCTGIHNVSAVFNGLSVYPNPTDGKLTISLATINENTSIRITNTLGQVVTDEKMTLNNSSFNIAHLPNGVYFVKIQSSNASQTIKVVKQ